MSGFPRRLALRGATLAPLVSRSWPSVTTVSPPVQPAFQ